MTTARATATVSVRAEQRLATDDFRVPPSSDERLPHDQEDDR